MTPSLFSLNGKTVAVIGAGSGIGREVAGGCAEHGARVACLDLDLPAARRTAADIAGPREIPQAGAVDVRDARSVERALGELASRHGLLDVVVSTPGINVRKPMIAYTDDEFDRVIDLNLKGTFHVLQAAGRIMSRQHSGSIIVFSSIRARAVEPGQSVYAASKAGMEQLVRALASELGPLGVRVNAVAPAMVETALSKPIRADPAWNRAYVEKTALGRWARAEEMVGAVVYLASEASTFVTGSVLLVDGGWTAIDGRFNPPGM